MRKSFALACIPVLAAVLVSSGASAQTAAPEAAPADPAAQPAPAAALAPPKTKMTKEQKIAVAVGALSAFMQVVKAAQATPAATQPATPVQP